MNVNFLVDIQQNIIGFLTPSMIWLFFIVIVAFTAFVSLVVMWHWAKHGRGLVRIVGVEILYLAITGAILVGLFIITGLLASQL